MSQGRWTGPIHDTPAAPPAAPPDGPPAGPPGGSAAPAERGVPHRRLAESLVDWDPEELRKLPDGTKEMVLSMGPQHPSTHGVLRLEVRLDGEQVVSVQPDIGYLHRSWEKIVETWTYPQIVPFSDRNDYLAGTHNEHVVCLAVERLMGIEVPRRGEYIRVIMSELQRIASHLLWFGTFCLDLGATSPFLWAFREREKVYNLFEMVTGGRLFPQFFRLGGVRNDFPPGFHRMVDRYLHDIERSVTEWQEFLDRNPIFRSRTRGIGLLPADQALSYGCSGPMLRASGIRWDVRRADPYSVYPELDFEVPVESDGDVYARYRVRMREIFESIRIVRQALEGLPEGDFLAPSPRAFRPPEGEIYVHVESPRGELGVYLVSDGSKQPWRLKWRSPCFSNLHAVVAMAPGHMLADLVAIVGSIDIVLGEVDR